MLFIMYLRGEASTAGLRPELVGSDAGCAVHSVRAVRCLSSVFDQLCSRHRFLPCHKGLPVDASSPCMYSCICVKVWYFY